MTVEGSRPPMSANIDTPYLADKALVGILNGTLLTLQNALTEAEHGVICLFPFLFQKPRTADWVGACRALIRGVESSNLGILE
jgi:hypothetical protein